MRTNNAMQLKALVKKKAVQSGVSAQRGSVHVLDNFEDIVDEISDDDRMRRRWEKYAQSNSYSKGISLKATCSSIRAIMSELGQ